ncbi:uncharacterized protein A4U43_C01F16140 [Asparagus officinalis]|uniref:BURP domain-containing protein n=1 Tax=Asparagus officinalis TaxID=4686 RepID=A0A5P1FQK2_ASPOF|nr:uncharacterized protein A4U43_C01F16140 [Asparagus officinalis]
MENTLLECEEPSINGETKHCATSIESMVEFTTTILNTLQHRIHHHNPQHSATSVTIDEKNSPKQKYTIKPTKMLGLNLVVCHAQTYAYVVFYCHMINATEAYQVSMIGEDGAKAEAICHADSGGWNPKHVAFRVLGVKPGSVPVCHFLPQDHVAWSRKK